MTPKPQITLGEMEGSTQFGPLVALGYWLRDQDLFSPILSRLEFTKAMHTVIPAITLLDLWVSILAGCRSVSQINTRLRPDRVLARAWGRSCFCEQSTVARVLDACEKEQVHQLQSGVEQLYRRIGQAPYSVQADNCRMVDIDLTGMPAGRQAEGSTKGYFGREKGGVGGSYAGLALRIMMR